MIATCPHCGYDLEALASFTLGDLCLEHGGDIIRWKGERVPLTVTQRWKPCA